MGEKNCRGRERRSSFFSMFNGFRSGKGMRKYSGDVGGGGGEDNIWDDAVNLRRVRHSDEDKERWVGEPDIDRKASAFIARFYESRVSESEIQTIRPPI